MASPTANERSLPSKVQVSKARQRVRFVRLLVLTGVGAILLSILLAPLINGQGPLSFFLASILTDVSDKFLLRTWNTIGGGGLAACVFIFIMTTVQLVLDIGPGVHTWWKVYRQSVTLIETAAEMQTDANTNSYMIDTPGADDDRSGPEQLASKFDKTETDLWTTSNYAFITRSIVDRLAAEISAQGARANTNLSIALAIATLGLGILVWLAWTSADLIKAGAAPDHDHLIYYLGAFTAKVVLSISANVFAFFFLSTYRRNLSEVRYFHNELTNVQARIQATYIAIERDEKDSLKDALKSLSATERNFILKKGESTTDLGQKQLDSADAKDFLSALSDIGKMAEKLKAK